MSSAIRILRILFQVPHLLQSVAVDDVQLAYPLEPARIERSKVAMLNLRRQCVT